MEHQQLGTSDLIVPRLCFGCGPMGAHGYGDVSTSVVCAAAEHAISIGLNFFDTADIYGLGLAEEVLGKCLIGKRNQAIIATKCGVRRNSDRKTFYDNSHAWISEALEASLKRLRTDYIDLYFIHYLDGKTPVGEVLASLQEFTEQGKIRYFGLSNISSNDLAGISLPPKLVAVQGEYSLVTREKSQDIRAMMNDFHLGFMAYGALGQGMLSGKYSADSSFSSTDRRIRSEYVNFYGDRLTRNLKIVEELKSIGHSLNKSCSQIAIRWVMDSLAGSIPIVGIKNIEQLVDCAGSFGWIIPDHTLQLLSDM